MPVAENRKTHHNEKGASGRLLGHGAAREPTKTGSAQAVPQMVDVLGPMSPGLPAAVATDNPAANL